MLLKILIQFSLFALVSTSQVLRKRQGRYDITRKGRYTIVNCGNRDATRLAGLIDNLWTVLRPSLRDVSHIGATPAFRTFFGSADNAPYVRQVLTNATTGVSLYPPEQQFQQKGSPLLICATAGGQVVGKRNGIDYYYQCILDSNKGLIAISGTPYIVICPYFFSNRVSDSPPAEDCLTINTSINRFQSTGSDFTNFKIWILLEGIVRYYIYATTRSWGTFATDANECTRLGATQMTKNPSNYVYYVASIYGQCRDFPDYSVPRRRLQDNITVPDPMYPEDERTNATTLPIVSALAASNQAIVVDPLGNMDTPST